jgi:hypothetical protein
MSLGADLAGVKRLFMSRMVQKTMDAEVAAIDNLKRLLESYTVDRPTSSPAVQRDHSRVIERLGREPQVEG